MDVNKASVRLASEWVRQEFDDDAVRNISEVVYRLRLESGDLGERMIREDEDNGEKLRGRSGGFDSITRDFLKAMILLGHMKP